MSFAEKIGSLMQRPNDDLVPKDEIPWWLKYGGRGVGTIAGAVGIFMGLWNIITGVLSGFTCIIFALWQVVAGFSVLAIEAPCCCMFVDHVQYLSDWVEKRPYWNRAAYYMVVAVIPLVMCFNFSAFLGCGLIFATGVLYGMMALGKKASMEEMRTTASNIASPHQQFPPSTMDSNLVDSSQPTSFTNPFNSRV